MTHKLFKFLACVAIVMILCSCGGGTQPPQPQTESIPADTATASATGKPAIAQLPKCNVSVYIENSASMDGYVKGVTEFEQAIYSYISDIKLADFCGNPS